MIYVVTFVVGITWQVRQDCCNVHLDPSMTQGKWIPPELCWSHLSNVPYTSTSQYSCNTKVPLRTISHIIKEGREGLDFKLNSCSRLFSYVLPNQDIQVSANVECLDKCWLYANPPSLPGYSHNKSNHINHNYIYIELEYSLNDCLIQKLILRLKHNFRISLRFQVQKKAPECAILTV